MDTDDDEDPVEVDVCLRGFSVVPLGHLPGKVLLTIYIYKSNNRICLF